MTKIPKDYLPPKELWPQYLIPSEYKDVPSHLNLAEELLDKHVKASRGGKAAIYFMDRKITYRELQKMVNKLGNSLIKLGIEAQDRVGIRMLNTPEAIISNFAILKIGAVPVPMSPLWSGNEILYTCNNAELKAFIISAPLLGEVEKVKDGFKQTESIIAIGGKPDELKVKGFLSYEELMNKSSEELEPVRLKKDDIGVILYTSGTTGPPKGCVHFVDEIFIEAMIVNNNVYQLSERDVLGGSAPVSFAAGYGTFGIIPFAGGAAISLIAKFTPEDILKTIPKHRITVLTGLPTAYRKMLELENFDKYDISSVRMYTTGGDSLGVETLSAWKKKTGKPIWEGLGATEMFHLVTSNTMGERPIPNSIGLPLPGFEIKVMDQEGSECEPGMLGRLGVKGPTGTVYWKPYEDYGRLLSSQKRGVSDGWNILGDMVQKDKNGYIFFVSREDDMIKSSGYRINPDEVEKAVLKHPAVKDVGVIGVPDPVRGQNVKAFVKLSEEYEPSENLKEYIIQSCRQYTAVYKLPREIEFSDKIPRSPTGKLLRKILRKR